MPQKPLKKGEPSRVTGIRLVMAVYKAYQTVAEELVGDGFPKNVATKSEIMRCVLNQYSQYAKVAFVKKNGMYRNS